MANKSLEYVNYNKMIDGTQELLTSDKWSISFDKIPEAIYWPGDLAVKFRVKTIDGLEFNVLYPHTGISDTIRGFSTPLQPGMVELPNSTITITLLDYSDQSILACLSDWIFKCNNPITKASLYAYKLRANLTVLRLDAEDNVVRSWKILNAMPDSPIYTETMNGERTLIGSDVSLMIKGQVMPLELHNLK